MACDYSEAQEIKQEITKARLATQLGVTPWVDYALEELIEVAELIGLEVE